MVTSQSDILNLGPPLSGYGCLLSKFALANPKDLWVAKTRVMLPTHTADATQQYAKTALLNIRKEECQGKLMVR